MDLKLEGAVKPLTVGGVASGTRGSKHATSRGSGRQAAEAQSKVSPPNEATSGQEGENTNNLNRQRIEAAGIGSSASRSHTVSEAKNAASGSAIMHGLNASAHGTAQIESGGSNAFINKTNSGNIAPGSNP